MFDPDELVHGRTRLALLATLSKHRSTDFVDLRDRLELTDGNMHVHLRKLETGGLITLRKTGAGPRSKTRIAITFKGRRALNDYLTQLETLIREARGAPAKPES